MEKQNPQQDSAPPEMMDFEKNAPSEELEHAVHEPDPNQSRQERGNRGPEEEPGFGQSA